MINIQFFLIGVAVMFLSACATTPLQPLPSTHPASPYAPEAQRRQMQPDLSSDEASQHTKELLTSMEKMSAPAPTNSMSNMPGM